MTKTATVLYLCLAALLVAGFAATPQLILAAPIPEGGGFIQKIFYYHVPVAWVAFLSVVVSGVGSVAYLARRARSRDVLLAIVIYPLTVPVIIAGVLGTAALCQAPPQDAVAHMWLRVLVVFDVVFVTLSLWIFEPLLSD